MYWQYTRCFQTCANSEKSKILWSFWFFWLEETYFNMRVVYSVVCFVLFVCLFFLLPQARDVSKAVWNICTSLSLFNLPALTQRYHSVIFPSCGILKIIVFETLHKFILNLSCNVVFLPSSGGQLFLLGYFSSCLLVFYLWAATLDVIELHIQWL